MKHLFLKLSFVLVILCSPYFASAGTEHNMSGYAWSSNIGWISFNCSNTNTCGTVNYGVHKAPDGRLCGNDTCSVPGYAWSSNIGWIQFGGLGSGFPVGAGTYSQDAQVVSGQLRGWARTLSYGSGFDGWIALTGSSYGVTLPATSFVGYAWGADVLGWISFNAAGGDSVKISGDATLSVSGITQGSNVAFATIPTFNWTMVNILGSCSITKIAGGSPFSTPINNKTTSGSQVEDALTVAGVHTYSIDCTNPSVSKQFSFTVLPQPAQFTLGPDESVRIQILPTGTADSEEKVIFVEPNAAFSATGNPVTVTITTYPAPIASTTFMYSFDGGTNYYPQGSGLLSKVITAPYTSGLGFKVRITRLAGAPQLVGPYVIRFTGTAPGPLSATKDAVVNLVPFDPQFQEI